MGVLNHQQLMIVKGVGPVPTDASSAEQPLLNVDLLNNNAGFSLLDWSPNVPSLKSGGVWADSPITDGRTLVSGQNTNVVETMKIQLTGATCIAFAAQFAGLQKMIQDARAFWDTFYQIEPVYLQWWAHGAPGAQYALIYNIDMKVTWQDATNTQAALDLSIEREFGWRGVRPGGNPKEWTYYKRGQPFNSSVAALTTGTDHLLNATAQNRREWNSGQTALISQNYFDIPATSIPGDLPALACLSLTLSNVAVGVGVQRIYFGRTTKPDLPISGVTRLPGYTLNAGEASLGTDTSLAADTGAPIVGVAQTAQRTVTNFGTPGLVLRLTWDGLARRLFDMTSLRGRFVAFARARVSAAATVNMNLRVLIGGAVALTYPSVTLTDLGGGGAGNTTSWSFVYLGVLNFPTSEVRAIVDNNGLGIRVTADSNYNLELHAARTAGAGNLFVSDVILLPIDELAGVIDFGVGTANNFVIDNTGYYAHGRTADSAVADNISAVASGANGQTITLKPGVTNRIVLIESNGASPPQSENPPVYTVRLNIVPRWSGIRDA